MSKETITDDLSKLIHDIVSDEISRVEEEQRGIVRRDGGRLMQERIIANQIECFFTQLTKLKTPNQ